VEEVMNESTLVVLTEDVACDRMNEDLDKLGELREQLTADGALTADVALEHQALTGSSKLVDAYFSRASRLSKLQIAQEGIFEQAKNLLKKAMDLLWDMILKVYNWFRKLITDNKFATEEALEAKYDIFKNAMGPVQRAERVPSSRTAIIAAVREAGLNEYFIQQLKPENMDIYNEGPYHQAVQRMIPALDGFDVGHVVESLTKWHDKWLPAARQFDDDNTGSDQDAVSKRLQTFLTDMERDLESATQMAARMMEVRLESYQKAQEERRKVKLDPNFHLGTDLSGIMQRGTRIFEQSGYKKMGGAMLDVYKGLQHTVSKLQSLRAKANAALNGNGPVGAGIANDQATMGVDRAVGHRAAEERLEALYMKEVNKVIATLHQCVMMIQFMNNYFHFVVETTDTILRYVGKVAQEAIKQGGDQASLSELIQAAANRRDSMVQYPAGNEQTDMG
jgi:hypothetical protein